MKMCEAFARSGHRVTLVAKDNPERLEGGIDNDHSFYGVAPIFEIVKVPRPSWRGASLALACRIQTLMANARSETDLLYSRDLIAAYLGIRSGYPTVFEAHEVPDRWWSRAAFGRLARSSYFRRLVVISRALKEDLARLSRTREEKVVIAHDGADPAASTRQRSRRTQPTDRVRLQVGYAGSLYPGRGIGLILELARRQPEHDIHIIGGESMDLEQWSHAALPRNLVFHGHVPHALIPDHLASFDVALLPYQRRVMGRSRRSDTSRWMSPMKMFEYMAAGLPIVSSDLPVLREVLENGRNALLVSPDDLDAWAKAISLLAANAGLRRRLGEAARADLIEYYTWETRARSVLADL